MILGAITPLQALGGGLLIGAGVALLLLLSGRIAGVSGLAAAAAGIADRGPSWAQSVSFVIAIPIGALLVSHSIRQVNIEVTSSAPLLIAAGLLVGFGTRLANGCTSGHGVCGMARLSPRSISATVAFLALGLVTVFIVRHAVGALA
ncbi:MAG TPA: YeeE/YedE thiosulfate transporter family protein [Sphingomicrobium sp.]|nr:YeeE/YedE thiosulfate transporter family protein [Sphingomicrobium sp.]